MTETLTGQDIGRAHLATRAVLNRRLDELGIDFQSWVFLNSLTTDEGAQGESELIARVGNGLKINENTAAGVLSGLVGRELVTRSGEGLIRVTTTGSDLVQQVRASIVVITEQLYGGLPAEDLAVAHRVITTVTARADAALSAG